MVPGFGPSFYNDISNELAILKEKSNYLAECLQELNYINIEKNDIEAVLESLKIVYKKILSEDSVVIPPLIDDIKSMVKVYSHAVVIRDELTKKQIFYDIVEDNNPKLLNIVGRLQSL